MVIDPGLPLAQFSDVVSSHHELIDFLKIGWGTCLVTGDIVREKLALLEGHNIQGFFGGTLFELFVRVNDLEGYIKFCKDAGVKWVEASSGTLTLPDQEMAEHIATLKDAGFNVFAEVGSKSVERSKALSAKDWLDSIAVYRAAGADYLIMESRESGRCGIADEKGNLRPDIIRAIHDAGVPTETLVFEAATKQLQVAFLTMHGQGVNLANIAPADIVSVATLRQGSRSDTLGLFFDASRGVDVAAQ